MGELSFSDDADTDVVQQENFLIALGCEKIAHIPFSSQISRRYRLPLLVGD